MSTLNYGLAEGSTGRTARWMYRGLWAILVRFLRVPETPPGLPAHGSDDVLTFRPAPAFLVYLKVQYWIGMSFISLVTFLPLLILAIEEPIAGTVIVVPAGIFIGLLGAMSFVALHLRFDTTWYVVSDRAMRLRQGVWSVHEVTITFENIQNVRVSQGPLQRYFGIADVVVETAGGGVAAGRSHKGTASFAHHGIIRGIDNAPDIRDRILAQLKRSTSAGIGDDPHNLSYPPRSQAQWSAAHIQTLLEIRDGLRTAGHHGG